MSDFSGTSALLLSSFRQDESLVDPTFHFYSVLMLYSYGEIALEVIKTTEIWLKPWF